MDLPAANSPGRRLRLSTPEPCQGHLRRFYDPWPSRISRQRVSGIACSGQGKGGHAEAGRPVAGQPAKRQCRRRPLPPRAETGSDRAPLARGLALPLRSCACRHPLARDRAKGAQARSARSSCQKGFLVRGTAGRRSVIRPFIRPFILPFIRGGDSKGSRGHAGKRPGKLCLHSGLGQTDQD